jgi:N-acetylglutamate synthase-like GNAT family acetyltransferase
MEIIGGYRPGIIARITEMHALYYARAFGFGQAFEVSIAVGIAEFCGRLGNPKNAIWVASHQGEIVGAIALDGEDANAAQLRWFIVAEQAQGAGVGRKLLAAALSFADEAVFSETYLWTLKDLSAARHLYQALGFSCVQEKVARPWGDEVLLQRFVKKSVR